MNEPLSKEQLLTLIDAACCGTIRDDQLAALTARLAEDPDSRITYVDYFEFFTELYWLGERSRPAPSVQPPGHPLQVASPLGVIPDAPHERRRHGSRPSSGTIPSFVGTALHGTVDYFSSGWPMAYLASTVICGIGISILALIPVYHHVQVARQSLESQPSSTSRPSPFSPLPASSPLVGRITGVIDCQFVESRESEVESPESKVQPSSLNSRSSSLDSRLSTLISVGDKYALASGLMEITYDTGAKVVLQGPCTYEVESKAGGYLSVGKLTARVEKRSEVRGQRSVASNQKSEIRNQKSPFSTLHSPLFTIKTPTATVTDLGTEFGVEVDQRGGTRSHVFRGRVEVRMIGRRGKEYQAVELGENESALVETASSGELLMVRRAAVDPAAFVRHEQLPKLAEESRRKPLRQWQAHSRTLRDDPTLVAYYTFEPHEGSTATLPNQSAIGNALDGEVHNAEWVTGRFPGKLALRFFGPGSGGKVVLPEQERFGFTGPFSVAVWFKAEPFTAWWQALITKGDVSWRLQQSLGSNQISFDTDYEPASEDNHNAMFAQPAVDDGRWHLAVAVYEPAGDIAHKRLYIDGRLEAQVETPAPLRQNGDPVWIGAHGVHPDREFQGLIDEVAVFSRALSAHDITTMFGSGNVQKTGDVRP